MPFDPHDLNRFPNWVTPGETIDATRLNALVSKVAILEADLASLQMTVEIMGKYLAEMKMKEKVGGGINA